MAADHNCVVDFGCGFGMFSVPAAARNVHGTGHATDIDPAMVEVTRKRAEEHGRRNLKGSQRDFVELGCGLSDGFADFVMQFNILHAQEAEVLLSDAARVLAMGGILAVMHWNFDSVTPRGPSMEIRLWPDQCRSLIKKAGFRSDAAIDLPPYHYEFRAVKVLRGDCS